MLYSFRLHCLLNSLKHWTLFRAIKAGINDCLIISGPPLFLSFFFFFFPFFLIQSPSLYYPPSSFPHCLFTLYLLYTIISFPLPHLCLSVYAHLFSLPPSISLFTSAYISLLPYISFFPHFPFICENTKYYPYPYKETFGIN